ncbi:MAG: EMC3/TMCO1 family protein [Thermoplasmata archaeon]
MPDEDAPLPSAPAPLATAPVDEDDDEEDEDDEPGSPSPSPAPRPPAPTFKISTMIYVFLGTLGFLMLVDTAARNQLATLFGVSSAHSGPLYFLIGFHSQYLLLTMAIAGAIEMLITSVAYNFTTNWVKAAKVQTWSTAFRKVQMEAIRSGKKDRIEALKPHQERLTRLSGEVSIAQFKGMAITYFLLILIYTWVGLVINPAAIFSGAVDPNPVIALGGASLDLTKHVVYTIPWWFVIFSLYTVPFSLVFRRLLKQMWLRRYSREHRLVLAPGAGAVGGPA